MTHVNSGMRHFFGGDGRMNRDEFNHLLRHMGVRNPNSKAARALWKQADRNHNGHVSPEEMRKFINKLMHDLKMAGTTNDGGLDQFLKKFDRNEDDKLSKNELKKLMNALENMGNAQCDADMDDDEYCNPMCGDYTPFSACDKNDYAPPSAGKGCGNAPAMPNAACEPSPKPSLAKLLEKALEAPAADCGVKNSDYCAPKPIAQMPAKAAPQQNMAQSAPQSQYVPIPEPKAPAKPLNLCGVSEAVWGRDEDRNQKINRDEFNTSMNAINITDTKRQDYIWGKSDKNKSGDLDEMEVRDVTVQMALGYETVFTPEEIERMKQNQGRF